MLRISANNSSCDCVILMTNRREKHHQTRFCSQQPRLTVGEVDSIVAIDFDGFRVELNRLLEVALLELFVATLLQ